MQYRLIIDKQPMDNPSDEKKEYKIDIEELRYKGKIHDSLIIKMNKAHVVRRLALTKNHVLKVLLEPIKEPLEDINIELFEGNNYIYLIDMIGNAFYVEYLNRTGFNDIFATRTEMRGAIEVSSREIELSVDKKFTNYLTAEETKAMIKLEADSIRLDVKNIKENAVSNVDVMYALSNSETIAPTTEWSTTAPVWEQGKYMWQKTITTYADETTNESEPTCISGAKGKDGTNGKDGAKGDTGIGAKKFVEQYYLSTSNTTQTGGMWKTAEVKWEENKYIWTRTQITWTDDTVTYTDPVLATNINGLSETTAKIEEKANLIDLEVKKKVNSEDVTAAKIMMMINDDESEILINGDKIDIDGKAVHFKTNISRTIGPFTQNDLNKIRDYIMEEGTLTQEEFKKYDVTGDNIISALDYTFAKKAMDNGGYLTFSGTYEINPNSENKSIALYDTRLQTYKAIISLLYNYFHALYVDDLEANSLNVTGKSGYLVAIDDDYNDTFEVVVNGIIKTPQGFVYATENLYDNESGTTGTVSLSENASNFEYIEIFYWDNNNASCHSTKVFNPNGKNVALFTLEGATNMYARSRNIIINGTSITNSQYSFASFSQGNYSAVDNTNYIKIYKVIGYR